MQTTAAAGKPLPRLLCEASFSSSPVHCAACSVMTLQSVVLGEKVFFSHIEHGNTEPPSVVIHLGDFGTSKYLWLAVVPIMCLIFICVTSLIRYLQS